MYSIISEGARRSLAAITLFALVFSTFGFSLETFIPFAHADTSAQVTIEAYVDGQLATATNANSAIFPMNTSWNGINTSSSTVAGTGSPNLSATNSPPYQFSTPDFQSLASYNANEVTGGAVVGTSCMVDGQPFALVGYTSGATLAAAMAATPTATPPSLTNFTQNEYIIVWNTTCGAPTVSSISPSSGTTAGGTSVTITGTNLTGATAVDFGTTPATGVTVVSDTSVTATSPAGTAGTADVMVTTPSGTSVTTSADQFTYVAPVAPVTSVTTMAATGITSADATLNGINGSTAATDASFWVSTSTFSTASSAALPNGVYSTPSLGPVAANTAFSALLTSVTGLPTVTANTPYYFAAWSEVGGIWSPGAVLTFTTSTSTTPAAPTVSSISPSSGTTAGGTSVTITGTNLTGATAVDFGTTPATGVTVVSDTSVTATSPAGTAGTADVMVTTPSGTSVTTSADQFTYVAPGGGGSPSTFTVTIDKYVNGMQATAADANSATFPMFATTTESNIDGGAQHNVNYNFDTTNSYRGTTVPLASGADYALNEVTGGAVVGTSCMVDGQPFALVGYTTSAISLADAAAATSTLTSPSFTNMTSNEYIIVWNESCPNSTGTLSGTVGSGIGTLAVTSITPVQTNATADDTYADGWSYLFDITVPTNQPNLAMEFANWFDAASSSTLPVAGNMQISSAQANNGGAEVPITAANTYSTPALDMTGNLSTTTPGLHVQVLVQTAIPLNTVDGSYTTSYGVQTLP